MSCRVLGRHLETWMLRKSLDFCELQGLEKLIGGYVRSNRNEVAHSFLLDHGFKPISFQEAKLSENSTISTKKNEEFFEISTSISELPYEDLYA